MLDAATPDEERRFLARRVATSRFQGLEPDDDISQALDEPGERAALAMFLNGPIAQWVANHSSRWRWVVVMPGALENVATLRGLGTVCYAHLAPRVDAVALDSLALWAPAGQEG